MKIARYCLMPWLAIRSPLFLYRNHRWIHALRVMLAFLFGLMLNISLPIQHGSWMLVTIVIVLSNTPHLGAVAQKAGQRLLGTILGALAGLLAIMLYRVSPLLCYSWMAAVISMSAYHAIGKAGYTAVMIGISLVIVAGVGDGTVTEALWRTGNVALGSMIGMGAATLFPQRALNHWRFLLADNLREAAFLYSRIARRLPIDSETALRRFNTRIIAMRGLIAAVSNEFPHLDLDSIQRRQRALYSLFDRMNDVADKTPPLDDEGKQRLAIVKALFRSARGVRFAKPDLLLNSMPEHLQTLSTLSPCHWLSTELAQTTMYLCDELLQLITAIQKNQASETKTELPSR
jgi:uncharacterized membrane protein YccC